MSPVVSAATTEILVAHYQAHGWVVVPDVFSTDEVDAVADIATRLAHDELLKRPDPSLTATVDHGRHVLAPRKLDWAFTKAAELRAFVLDPRLVGLVTTLIGQPAYLARDHVFLKPPRVGSPKPLHQDQTHFLCTPIDSAITAWVALDDTDLANGCLHYVDRSHQGPALEHRQSSARPHDWVPSAGSVAALGERHDVAIEVKQGSVSFHHPHTLHRSGANRSDRWRRAHSSQWVAAGVSCAGDLLEWAYSSAVGAGRHPVAAP